MAINLSIFLLLFGRAGAGRHTGVAPDIARAIADRLGVGLELGPFDSPGKPPDAADRNRWDVGLIGADPKWAHWIAFRPAYVQIAAIYLVPASSRWTQVSEVDRAGVRIAAYARSGYHL